MEIHIGNRVAEIELVSKEDNKVVLTIDGKPFEADVVMAENGTCNILMVKAIKDLKIAVEVGLVVGTIPAITPRGSATTLIPLALSSLIIPQVLAFLCLL